jgi:hypothetical protein
MIPEEVIQIFSGTMVTHIGTRDSKLQTTEVMGFGVNLDVDKKHLTVFIPKSTCERTLANISNNKKMAVTVGEPMSHVLFQFKGDYMSHAEASESDEHGMDNYLHTFYENYLKLFGYPPEVKETFDYKPAVGITFAIEEIFVQTPGPKAGTTIYKNKIAYGNR